MTSKLKALELFNKHYLLILEIDNDLSQEIIISILAIKNALLTVDEILDFITKYDNHMKDYTYWEEVKQEIEKL